ncbi:MAG: TonB-dependent receptor [Aureispira sp.]|nr:TonB-dependent receptor [Aureispira sp.]
MSTKLIITLFTIFLFTNLHATDLGGNIRGQVLHKNKGTTITGAQIVLIHKKRELMSIVSDPNGVFVFRNITAGTYDLECRYPGHVTQRMVGLEIKDDRTKLAYFKTYASEDNYDKVDVIMTEASLQEQLKQKVSVSANSNESLEDVPATVHIITKQDIDNRGYTDLSEVLMDIPEIEIQQRYSSEQYNLISSRGISGNEKLLILMNGVRMSSMALSSLSIYKNFSIRYADRIEIVLGPSSALYEADAFVGVVNIITHNEKSGLAAKLSGSYGMYNTTDNSLLVGWGNNDFKATVGGSFYTTADPNYPKLFPNNYRWHNNQDGSLQQNLLSNSLVQVPITTYSTPLQAISAYGVFGWKDLELGVMHNNLSFSSSTAVKPTYTSYNANLTNRISLTNAYLKHDLVIVKKKLHLESIINWNHYRKAKNSTSQNVYTGYDIAYQFAYDHNIRIRETFKYKLNKAHQFSAGLSFTYTDALPETSYSSTPFVLNKTVEEQNMYYSGSNYVDADGLNHTIYQDLYFSKRYNAGIFFQYRVNINDKLLVTLGARTAYTYNQTQNSSVYDQPITRQRVFLNLQIDSASNLVISPRIAVVYKPNDHWRLKLFYGASPLNSSLKSQYSHYGLFTPTTNSVGLVGKNWRLPNNALTPQEVQTLEGNFTYSNGNFKAIANGYFNYVTNLIKDTLLYNQEFKGIPIERATIPINSEKGFNYGGTIYIRQQFLLGTEEQFKLNIHASYSYNNGKLNQLSAIPFTAAHTVKSGVLFIYKGFSCNTSLLYRSATLNEGFADEDGIFSQYGSKGYVVLNLFTKYKVYNNIKNGFGIDIFAKVQNLTNAQYFNTTANNPALMGAMPQTPILIQGGVSLSLQR